MINKTKMFLSLFKNKKNKIILIFKKFLKPIFFLKYIFLVIILSALIYLFIPKFFDFDKGSEKEIVIKNKILSNYKIELEEHSGIIYKILPTPHLIINSPKLDLGKNSIKGSASKLVLSLKIFQLYNYKYLKIDKIILDDPDLIIEIEKFKSFLIYVKKLSENILIRNGKLSLMVGKNRLIEIENAFIKNEKNISLSGTLLNKKIKIIYANDLNIDKLNLSLPEMGLKSKTFFNNKSSLENFEGYSLINILDNNIKFDFKKDKEIKISNSSWRNKALSTSFDGFLILKPYFSFDLLFNILKLNTTSLISNSFLKDLINNTNINKKLNGKLRLINKNSKYFDGLVKHYDIKFFLENSDIKFKKSSMIFAGGDVIFSGLISDYDGFKNLNFEILFNFKDRKTLTKKFKLKKSKKNDSLDIEVMGNLNLSSRKINFNRINVNGELLKNKEDIKYVEDSFESELIKKNLTGLFDFKNIKNFVNAVY